MNQPILPGLLLPMSPEHSPSRAVSFSPVFSDDHRFVLWRGMVFQLFCASEMCVEISLPLSWGPEWLEPVRHHVAVAWRSGVVCTTAQIADVISELKARNKANSVPVSLFGGGVDLRESASFDERSQKSVSQDLKVSPVPPWVGVPDALMTDSEMVAALSRLKELVMARGSAFVSGEEK